MPDNGKNFTAPGLTKRTPRFGATLNVTCGQCTQEYGTPMPVDSWLYYGGKPGEPPMVFTATCHGETLNWGIEDVEGFESGLTAYATEGRPFMVFGTGKKTYAEAEPNQTL